MSSGPIFSVTGICLLDSWRWNVVDLFLSISQMVEVYYWWLPTACMDHLDWSKYKNVWGSRLNEISWTTTQQAIVCCVWERIWDITIYRAFQLWRTWEAMSAFGDKNKKWPCYSEPLLYQKATKCYFLEITLRKGWIVKDLKSDFKVMCYNDKNNT